MKPRRHSGSTELTQKIVLRPEVKAPDCWCASSSVLPWVCLCVAPFSEELTAQAPFVSIKMQHEFWFPALSATHASPSMGLLEGTKQNMVPLCIQCSVAFTGAMWVRNSILWDSPFFYRHFIYSHQVNWFLKRHLNLGRFFPPNQWNSQAGELWSMRVPWVWKINQFPIPVLSLS